MTQVAGAKTVRLMLFGLFLIVLFFLVSSLWAFYMSVRPPKITSRISPKDLGLNYQTVSFATDDGVTLRGWFIPHKDAAAAKTIVALHGYPADKGNILPALVFLCERYNLFLFDSRYLGESEGSYSTVGAKEVKDLIAAIAFLRTRGVREVGVWGFSMGGAVALMTAPSAPEIKAVVSQSSYARLDLLAPALFRLPVLKSPLAWLTTLWAKIFLGINLREVSPKDAARDLNIPVLLIHSKHDSMIPFDHALMLQESLKNNPKAQFWFDEHLVHGQFAAEYKERIGGFFDSNL
jgi:dipeptidyl aminopeptidase/acylaminoacyl peptidase